MDAMRLKRRQQYTDMVEATIEKRYSMCDTSKKKLEPLSEDQVKEWMEKNRKDMVLCPTSKGLVHKNNCGKLKACYFPSECVLVNSLNYDERVHKMSGAQPL